MASFKAQRALIPQFSVPIGAAVILADRIILASNPVSTDTLDFLIPAGIRVTNIFLINDQVDSSTGLLYGAGYRAVNTGSALSASATYFAAAGNTGLRSAGRQQFTFKPITFEEDVYLQIVIGATATTFVASSEVHAIVEGALVGIK